MTTITHFKRPIDRDIVKKLFAKFSSHYGTLWTSRLGANGNWNDCEQDWLNELCEFTLDNLKKAMKEVLINFVDFPPTLGQLVTLCLKASGIPSEDEVLIRLIRREFNHPIVKMLYDKIGSWELSNGKQETIKSKIKSSYGICLALFRSSPDSHWGALNQINQQKLLDNKTEPKIPSASERKSFSERMAEYNQKANEQLSKLKDQKHPEFDQNEVSPGHRDFKPEVYAEYKKYLLSVDDDLALSLPLKMAYQRMRFISEKERPRILAEAGYNPTTQGNNCESPRCFNGPFKVYKNFTKD